MCAELRNPCFLKERLKDAPTLSSSVYGQRIGNPLDPKGNAADIFMIKFSYTIFYRAAFCRNRDFCFPKGANSTRNSTRQTESTFVLPTFKQSFSDVIKSKDLVLHKHNNESKSVL